MPKVTFVQPDGSRRDVLAKEGDGLMRAAQINDIAGIIGECGGSMTCATCHVYVDEAWTARVGRPGEDEGFMLDFASETRPNSRLSCQVDLDGDLDCLVVHVPETQGSSTWRHRPLVAEEPGCRRTAPSGRSSAPRSRRRPLRAEPEHGRDAAHRH